MHICKFRSLHLWVMTYIVCEVCDQSTYYLYHCQIHCHLCPPVVFLQDTVACHVFVLCCTGHAVSTTCLLLILKHRGINKIQFNFFMLALWHDSVNLQQKPVKTLFNSCYIVNKILSDNKLTCYEICPSQANCFGRLPGCGRSIYVAASKYTSFMCKFLYLYFASSKYWADWKFLRTGTE